MAKKKKSARGLTSAAKILGSAGGKLGGPARARKLTQETRSRIAKMGGKARQRKKKG